jgi:hypothetical protein
MYIYACFLFGINEKESHSHGFWTDIGDREERQVDTENTRLLFIKKPTIGKEV